MNSFKMNREIVLVFFTFLLVLFVSCDDDSSPEEGGDDFDHEAQIPIDQALLLTYFEEHYVDSNSGELVALGDEELPVGETLLSDDPKLDSIVGIEQNSTIADYTLYYYITQEGTDSSGFGSPSPVDSVYVKYKGMLLDGTVFDSIPYNDIEPPSWIQLTNTIAGWSYGFQKFKRGDFSTSGDNDHEFSMQGEGYIFFPSGIGYKNFAQSSIPANSPLVFQLQLNDVNLIDTDLDDVPTKYEMTIDEAGNYSFYDTDGDGFNDYNDKDDDNDTKLTIDEVALEYPTFDSERGFREFTYDPTGKTIVAKGTTDGVPNYKDREK